MSYCNYYIGYRKDGKIYPWGPYTADGKLKSAVSRSSSFASELYREFQDIPDGEISEELRREFEWEDYGGHKVMNVEYLSEKDLPSGSFVKTGYFLIDDVKSYEKDEYDEFDGFYDVLSPSVYAAKLQHEITFGKNKPEKDIEGYEYTEPNASDYMYYAYPDYKSREYEAFILRQLIDALRSCRLGDDIEYVILKTEN